MLMISLPPASGEVMMICTMGGEEKPPVIFPGQGEPGFLVGTEEKVNYLNWRKWEFSMLSDRNPWHK